MPAPLPPTAGGRSFGWLSGASLDLRLGVRMMVKYPGLTVVGGLAMALAIWVGAGTFEFLTQMAYPRLPLPAGERVVALRQWDAEASRARLPEAQDVLAWREGLRRVVDVGGYRTSEHNLIAPGQPILPIEVAEMSAAGFRVARVAPLMGRPLVEEDERPGAPAVLVLGHEPWQRRFGGDPTIVGRQVRLGREVRTVVGVMPEDFAFPIAHDYWVPLRLDPSAVGGPELRAFARLAPGASLDEAQAELAAVGRRTAEARPASHAHLRPQVLPYARSFLDMSGAESAGVMAMNLFLVLLLALVCGNVALLMFARAVSREGELVVRTALGASRGRIVAQLFAESLVLAAVAAVVGLSATNAGLRWMLDALETQTTGLPGLPFWLRDRVSPSTVLYTAVLAVLGALVAGVLPALKVTRGLGARLRQASAGGGGYRFGGVWTVVIVAQVGLTVAFPAVAYIVQHEEARSRARDVGFATERFLSVRLEMGGTATAADTADAGARATELARVRTTAEELERRLEADPSVAGVTFAQHVPRMPAGQHEIELDEGGAAPVDPAIGYRRASTAAVALDYFSTLGVPVLQGRAFHEGDLAADARTVVVNRAFVDRLLGGRNPVGRHVRYVRQSRDGEPTRDEPWYRIVGVVPDLGLAMDPEGFYHPAAPGTAAPLHMLVHARTAPLALADRVRDVAASMDPTLRLHALMPLDDVNEDQLLVFFFWLVVLVSGAALLLSLAGIYAVMSFTVARRTREIGVRIALGADAWRLVGAVFRRPLLQVGLGILAGGALVAAMPALMQLDPLSARGVVLVAGYAAVMTGVCLLACVVPTRRALRVQPTEALRAEG